MATENDIKIADQAIAGLLEDLDAYAQMLGELPVEPPAPPTEDSRCVERLAALAALGEAAVAERKAFKDYYKDFGASRNENDILKNHALWVKWKELAVILDTAVAAYAKTQGV